MMANRLRSRDPRSRTNKCYTIFFEDDKCEDDDSNISNRTVTKSKSPRKKEPITTNGTRRATAKRKVIDTTNNDEIDDTTADDDDTINDEIANTESVASTVGDSVVQEDEDGDEDYVADVDDEDDDESIKTNGNRRKLTEINDKCKQNDETVIHNDDTVDENSVVNVKEDKDNETVNSSASIEDNNNYKIVHKIETVGTPSKRKHHERDDDDENDDNIGDGTKNQMPNETNSNEEITSNNNKKFKCDTEREDMFKIYQPWVIKAYGDLAKTKTITLKKQARIIKTLTGREQNNPDSSKFRFWVKAKGFTIDKPDDFKAVPSLVAYNMEEENENNSLYIPNQTKENGVQPFRKVAVVEHFFDIIYNVHVGLGGRSGRHAGQKRTYRTITESYAFLPREAVTKFLAGCSSCKKLVRSGSPSKAEDLCTESSSEFETSINKNENISIKCETSLNGNTKIGLNQQQQQQQTLISLMATSQANGDDNIEQKTTNGMNDNKVIGNGEHQSSTVTDMLLNRKNINGLIESSIMDLNGKNNVKLPDNYMNVNLRYPIKNYIESGAVAAAALLNQMEMNGSGKKFDISTLDGRQHQHQLQQQQQQQHLQYQQTNKMNLSLTGSLIPDYILPITSATVNVPELKLTPTLNALNQVANFQLPNNHLELIENVFGSIKDGTFSINEMYTKLCEFYKYQINNNSNDVNNLNLGTELLNYYHLLKALCAAQNVKQTELQSSPDKITTGTMRPTHIGVGGIGGFVGNGGGCDETKSSLNEIRNQANKASNTDFFDTGVCKIPLCNTMMGMNEPKLRSNNGIETPLIDFAISKTNLLSNDELIGAAAAMLNSYQNKININIENANGGGIGNCGGGVGGIGGVQSLTKAQPNSMVGLSQKVAALTSTVAQPFTSSVASMVSSCDTKSVQTNSQTDTAIFQPENNITINSAGGVSINVSNNTNEVKISCKTTPPKKRYSVYNHQEVTGNTIDPVSQITTGQNGKLCRKDLTETFNVAGGVLQSTSTTSTMPTPSQISSGTTASSTSTTASALLFKDQPVDVEYSNHMNLTNKVVTTMNKKSAIIQPTVVHQLNPNQFQSQILPTYSNDTEKTTTAIINENLYNIQQQYNLEFASFMQEQNHYQHQNQQQQQQQQSILRQQQELNSASNLNSIALKQMNLPQPMAVSNNGINSLASAYIQLLQSLGYQHEESGNGKLNNIPESTIPPISEPMDTHTKDDAYAGLMKDADKLKLMLLAWNYQNSNAARNGTEGPDLGMVSSLWAQYQNALTLNAAKPTSSISPRNEQSSPIETQDETNSSGQKDDDDPSEDESDDKLDQNSHDPERLKAFNMFVRLFVDENLDRMIPISKQPKEKIQAIIDSCTRQFPEFSERARKRIRTYLKSCRRNKKTRENWEATSRPTPAHLTSVQAEQILALACENESMNAKRMRIGLDPISQAMPQIINTSADTSAPSLAAFSGIKTTMDADLTAATVNGMLPTLKPNTICDTTKSTSLLTSPISSNCIGTSGTNSTITNPGSIYRHDSITAPAFSPRTQMYPNYFNNNNSTMVNSNNTTATFASNTPTDLSMKQNRPPLLPHKLNPTELNAVKQLVTGYRESAAFLLRSADELEQLLLQQQV